MRPSFSLREASWLLRARSASARFLLVRALLAFGVATFNPHLFQLSPSFSSLSVLPHWVWGAGFCLLGLLLAVSARGAARVACLFLTAVAFTHVGAAMTVGAGFYTTATGVYILALALGAAHELRFEVERNAP